MSYIVAVDDGHGFATVGKRTPDGYKENEFNHFTKEFLKEELIINGFKVVDCSPTREDNPLKNRCEIANKYKADIFASIHFNAFNGTWGTWGGIETYHYNNSVEGRKLATLVHQQLMQGTAMQDRGIKSAGFYVLKNTSMPAILCECGFMDNKREAALMKSETYRKECSSEICKGICNYFGVTYKPVKSDTFYRVQTGSFADWKNAENMIKELKKAGFEACVMEFKV
jgi:N-acetylmuramoyl-L-alanine amidase